CLRPFHELTLSPYTTLFRSALVEVMDEQLYDGLILQIRKRSLEVSGVLATEKCFVRKSGMKFHVDLHVIVDGDISVIAGHDIARSEEHTSELQSRFDLVCRL